MLTVEEAASVLRVGRTKAYAMAKEWRATGGRSGLPVVDFGSVLRVPRKALEDLVGLELVVLPDVEDVVPVTGDEDAEVIDLTDESDPAECRDEPVRRSRRTRRQPNNQPALFDLPPAS